MLEDTFAFYYVDPRGQTDVALPDGKEVPLPAKPSASTCYHSLYQILCLTLYVRGGYGNVGTDSEVKGDSSQT